MATPVLTREALLLGGIAAPEEGLGLGPEVVWLDVTARGAGLWPAPGAARGAPPMAFDVLLSLARQLQAGATRRVVLGWAADPTLHPVLPEVVDLLLAHGLELELHVPLPSLITALECVGPGVARVAALAEGGALERMPVLDPGGPDRPSRALTAVLDAPSAPELENVLVPRRSEDDRLGLGEGDAPGASVVPSAAPAKQGPRQASARSVAGVQPVKTTAARY